MSQLLELPPHQAGIIEPTPKGGGARFPAVQQFFSRYLPTGFIAILAFLGGIATGTTSSYISVRADAAALTARVAVEEQRTTAIEQAIAEWRAADARTAADLTAQIKAAVDILTDLRIRLGPGTGR